MTAINFKACFADAVASGQKKQTIRAMRKDGRRPKPGEKLQLYTGMRSKGCRKLRDAVCWSVSSIEIVKNGPGYIIVIDGTKLSMADWIDLAKADGFGSRAELIGFFVETYGLPFDGLIIRW